MTRYCVLALLLLPLASTSWAAQTNSTKARLVVLTDIEADPDDSQSLVRLLLYSNELDIEGIVATTSIHMREEIHPGSVVAIIDKYAQVRTNLLQHAPGYPTRRCAAGAGGRKASPPTAWLRWAMARTRQDHACCCARWNRRIRDRCGLQSGAARTRWRRRCTRCARRAGRKPPRA